MIAHRFVPNPWPRRDECDAKVSDDGRNVRQCGYPAPLHPQPADPVEALHELAWTICIAGQGERDELVPPCIGEARRGLAQRAIALIEACGG